MKKDLSPYRFCLRRYLFSTGSFLTASLGILSGCAAQSASVPISSGQELRIDLDQDGTTDRVYVKDMLIDDNGITRVTALLSSDGKEHTVDFEGYYSTALMSGDLSGNGQADILVLKYDTGSTFGAVDVSVLYFESGVWKKYPTVLVQNQEIDLVQPQYFGEEYYWEEGFTYCIGADIITEQKRTLLRLVIPMLDTVDAETVEYIDAAWHEDGWHIEDVQVVNPEQ